MIEAWLFVYGHVNQINWSIWRFAALPGQGDKISVVRDGLTHNLVVQHVEHSPVAETSAESPSVIIVTHWQGDDRPK